MPTYNYVALSAAGAEAKGTLTADTADKARVELKRMDLLPISIEEQGALSKDLNIKFLEKKPKPRDLSIFCRQFVSILDAGVPVVSALDMLASQTENRRLSAAIQETRLSVEKGESLAAALGRNEKIFGPMFISLIKAGEESGSLDVSLGRMAIQYEKEARLKALVKKATVYPAVLLIVTALVIVLMLAFVIPQFEDMFVDLGTELPGLTLAVMAASKFVQERWYIVIGAIVGIVLLLRAFAAAPSGKWLFGTIALRLPVVGNHLTKTYSARMTRTLSTLLAAGIPLIDALQIAAEGMTNVHFRDALQEAKDDVAMGGALSESLARTRVYPPIVHQMIKIGEESGNIDGMLTKVADYYDEEVENTTQALMAMLEPAIIVIMALIVGTIIMSVMLPMGEMYSALDNL